MGIFGAALRGFGKALKASKRKARRKRLGLPAETNKQIRTRLKKSKRAGKNTGPSTKEVMGFSGAVGGTAAAGIYTKKKDK